MVTPKESSWFQQYKVGTTEIENLEDSDFYQKDKIGLKTLN